MGWGKKRKREKCKGEKKNGSWRERERTIVRKMGVGEGERERWKRGKHKGDRIGGEKDCSILLLAGGPLPPEGPPAWRKMRLELYHYQSSSTLLSQH